MTEYIERTAAIEALAKLGRQKFNLGDSYPFYLEGLKDADIRIRALPIANVREVVLCGECVLSGHCWSEDVFKFARLSDEKRFCGVGKRASNAEKDGGAENG